MYLRLSTSDQELSQSKYLQWNIRQAANGYNSKALTIKVETVYINILNTSMGSQRVGHGGTTKQQQ